MSKPYDATLDTFLGDLLHRKVLELEESVTYQAIIRKGAKQEARKILLRQGQVRFGSPAPPEVQTAIEVIDDLMQLEELTDSVLTADSWQDLVQPPPPEPKPRVRKKRS